MKKVELVIRPSKLEEVKEALDKIEVRGMTVYDVKGRGLQRNQKQYYRDRNIPSTYFPRLNWRLFARMNQLKISYQRYSKYVKLAKLVMVKYLFIR